MNTSLILSRLSLVTAALLIAALALIGCENDNQLAQSSQPPNILKYEFEATGEDFLISALEEIYAIADWVDNSQNGPNFSLSGNTTEAQKMTLAKIAGDTVFIYGQIIPGGYGAVVTERYAHPKGLLLITVRKTYGRGDAHIVTETKRYGSRQDLIIDKPQQTNVTELFGTQADTIITHVLRNGTLETYTFRLPVVTKVVNPQDGSIRITTRYALNGAIVSKVEDGDGSLVQLRRSYGASDGSTITRTEFPDASWRQVRTHGEADGTVTRETTSGLPSLGSGNVAVPPIPPRTVLGFWTPLPIQGESEGIIVPGTKSRLQSFASGLAAPPPKPPRPTLALRILPGLQAMELDAIASSATLGSRSFASGLAAMPPKPPRRVIAAWTPLKTDRGEKVTIAPDSKSSFRLFASGLRPQAMTPQPVVAAFQIS